MKYQNLTLDEFATNHSEQLIEDFKKNIYDEKLQFMNIFIYEELNGQIPRLENNDSIVNILKHNVEADIYHDNFYGFDIMDDSAEEFLVTYKEEFEEWLHWHLKYLLETIVDRIKENIINGKISIFRGMKVKKDFKTTLIDNNVDYLGVCWTIEKKVTSQFAFEDQINDKIVLVSEICEREVDWETTFHLNLDPVLGDEEKEIRLFNNSHIELISFEINDKDILPCNETFIGAEPKLPSIESEIYDDYIKNNELTQEIANKLKDLNYDSLNEFIDAIDKYNERTKKFNKTRKNKLQKVVTSPYLTLL